MAETLFVLQLAATWSMVGVIWFVQVVHYPLFRGVGRDLFPSYEQAHQQLTTYVVMPLMFVEAGTAASMLAFRPEAASFAESVLGVVLLALVWLSTFFVQVPAHGRLSQSFDDTTHHWLVRSNWLRTFAWSGRGVLLSFICWRVMHNAA